MNAPKCCARFDMGGWTYINVIEHQHYNPQPLVGDATAVSFLCRYFKGFHSNHIVMATSGTPAAPAVEFSIESLLGSTLLEKSKTPAKPTTTLMKGKELIGLYFSASWCPPCKTFSPILASFYNVAAKAGNLEVVYISSDRTVADFEGYVSLRIKRSFVDGDTSCAVKILWY
jgi:thiol-disulfide isomerase/thioredoxin